MLERMKRLLACLLATLTGCASMPPWLDQTLASTNSQRLDPQIVAAAAADSDHIARIEAATRPPDPEKPDARDQARNLSYLAIQLHAGSSDRAPYLALARRMYAIDPEHHGYTLAAVAESQPFDVCEAEVLRIAFDPRTTDSIGWRSSRHLAAASLVARLATDPGVPMLPRPLPPGAPEFVVAEGRNITCNHWTLRAAYAQGDQAENIETVKAMIEPDSFYRPGDDHDAENCFTIIWRLTELGGRKP